MAAQAAGLRPVCELSEHREGGLHPQRQGSEQEEVQEAGRSPPWPVLPLQLEAPGRAHGMEVGGTVGTGLTVEWREHGRAGITGPEWGSRQPLRCTEARVGRGAQEPQAHVT